MNDTIQRAVRLVVATCLRYSGTIRHAWHCNAEIGPEEDCDCGADALNESMTILKDALKASGEPLPALTGEEVTTEINALLGMLQE